MPINQKLEIVSYLAYNVQENLNIIQEAFSGLSKATVMYRLESQSHGAFNVFILSLTVFVYQKPNYQDLNCRAMPSFIRKSKNCL